MQERSQAESSMTERMEKFHSELTKVRTGRANPAMLDGVKVEYYGQDVPVKQVAAVSVPEARTLEIRPWDKAALEPLEKALQKADLGALPQSDGNVVRITMPKMTEDRRKDLAKQVGKIGEEFRVAIRGIRRDAMEALRSRAKSDKIPEDEQKKMEGSIQQLTDTYIGKIDEAIEEKQKEVTTI